MSSLSSPPLMFIDDHSQQTFFLVIFDCCYLKVLYKIKAETLFFLILAVVSASFILFFSAVVLTYPDSVNPVDFKQEEKEESPRSLFIGATGGNKYHHPKSGPRNASLKGKNPDEFTASKALSPFVTITETDVRSFNTNDIATLKTRNEKLILLWTAWWEDKAWKKIFKRNGGPFVKLPPLLNEQGDVVQQRSCRLTLDRNLARIASGFVFHSFDLQPKFFDDAPSIRYPWQVWIFWMIEPPPRSGLLTNNDWDRANAMEFNITMSYLRHADVWFPYGRIYEYPVDVRRSLSKLTHHKIEGFVREFQAREFDAVWIVSDCSTYSGREKLVSELRGAGISVQSWGNCSHNSPDNEWARFGRKKFFSQYRFYFAFENTFCDDYVSEKAFIAMNISQHYGVIPVVYGAARYSTILPPGSFIDARSFQSAYSLAGYLKQLALPQSAERVRGYFAWQYKYYTDENEDNRVITGWQSLCQHLWDMDRSGALTKGVTIRNLRSRMGECIF